MDSRCLRYLAPALFAAAVLLGLASPAQADDGYGRWTGTTVCVDDWTHAPRWKVAEATHRLDDALSVDLIYSAGCDGYDQVVTVYDGNYGLRYGRWTGVVEYDKTAGRIVGARVFLNNRYARNWTPDQLVTVTMHELMHALGAGHNHRPDSVMGPAHTAKLHRAPTAYDVAEMYRRYAPPARLVRPAWRYVP
jgi:hypothetical protein